MSYLITAVVTLTLGVLVGVLVAAVKLRRLRAAYQQARWRADHDPLTGLALRQAAADWMHAQLAAAGQVTLILLDLDRFKQINDTYGHHVGDQVLVTIAGRLDQWARHRHGIACRLSGDEFLTVVARIDPDRQSVEVATLLDTVAAPITVRFDGAAAALVVTGTAGVTTSSHTGPHGWSPLLRQADVALYQARRRHHRQLAYRPGMSMPPSSRHGPRLRDQHPPHPTPPPPRAGGGA